jgi:hypothetical protein
MEQARRLDLSRGVSVDRRQRQSHDFADGREIVRGEIAEKGEQVLWNRWRLIDRARDGSHSGRRLLLRHRKYNTDNAPRADRADNT